MPRKRPQTRTGEDAQKIRSVPGQRYGEGVEQQALQRAMPAPDVTGNVPTPTMQGPAPAIAPSMPPQGVSAPPEAMQQFLMQNNPNLLGGTQRPDEPITAGLASGPGRNPTPNEMRASSSPIGRWFERLSMETGDPRWARMRERAGL